jgi:colicin import membrane protein
MESKLVVSLETPQFKLIEESKANQIKKTFEPMAEMLSSFEDSYNELMTLANQEITEEVTQKAKRLRLDISKVRIETGKIKDKQKEYIKLEDKAIMGVHNILVWAVKEKEDSLKEIENHFEKLEKERLEKLQLQRVELLDEFVDDASERDLSSMDEDVWDAYLQAKKNAYFDRIEAEKKAEEERQAKIKAEKEEQERIRKENERLKAEAQEKERIAKIEEEKRNKAEAIRLAKEQKEREKLETKLKKEREEREKVEREERIKREKIEAELKAKKDAELKAEQERLEKERLDKLEAEKLAKAPIKNQLNSWVDSFHLPETKIDNEKALLIKNKFDSFKKWAKSEIENI